jgi:hypothetical protein
MKRIWSVTGNLVGLAALVALAVVLSLMFGGSRGEQPMPEESVFQSPPGPVPPPPSLPTVTVVGTPTATATRTPEPTPLITDMPVPPTSTPSLPPVQMKSDGIRAENIKIVKETLLVAQQDGLYVGYGAVWSPDSSRLIFAKGTGSYVQPRKGGTPVAGAQMITEIWITGVKGVSQRKLAIGKPSGWSSEGNWVLYKRLLTADFDVQTEEQRAINVDSGTEKVFVDAYAYKNWSEIPNAVVWTSGKKAIMVLDNLLHLVDLNNSTQEQLADIKVVAAGPNPPSVSPDGRKLAFVEKGTANLWIMDLHSRKLRLLADHFTNARWGIGWSQDGQRIAYTTIPPQSDPWLHIAATDGTAETKIAVAPGFIPYCVWLSPDGNVVFLAWHTSIYVVNADGTHLRELVDGRDVLLFALSPDGTKIALIEACFGRSDCGLSVLDLTAG